MRQVLHVDCDCFFAAVEMRDQPHLRNVPLAIGGASDRRGVISTCNYLARKFGVRSAMASGQAKQLCPDLVLVPGNMQKYRDVSADVMEILKQYALQFEVVSVDEAYLELAPTSNAQMVAQQIRQQVESELGITVSVGIAPNKFLAKVASDWRKPNGQFAILPSEVDEFVARLEVIKIPGVGPKSAAKLHDMGIYTCGHVREVPDEILLKRFGKFGQLLIERAKGQDSRGLSHGRMRKSISVERTFAEDLQNQSDIEEALNDMWPKFLERIERANLKLEQLAPFVKVKFADFHVTTLAKQSSQASFDQYLNLVIEASKRDQQTIRLLGLGAKLLQPSAQLSLFE
ncbi:MAG: DNA polymerase IV [Bermanella sp.]